MARIMLIDAMEPLETRVVITDEGEIEHFDFITRSKKQIKGNIYLGKITRIEPSLQAAFVEYGGDKQGFLPFAEIHPDYYQIPVEDRKRLLEEAEAAAARREMEADEDMPHSRDREAVEAEEFSDEKPESSRDEKESASPSGRRKGRRRPFRGASVAQAADTSHSLVAAEEAASEAPSSDHDAEESAPSEYGPEEEDTHHGEAETHAEGHGGSEPEERESSHRSLSYRRYKIQEVIRPGQLVLVQVIKEERGNKGVSISTYISLAGRYCVLMPNSPRAGGISRKIASGEDRKRLKEISEELKDIRGMNAIIRTAGMDRTRAEIKRDYEYLIKLWNQVRDDALSSIAPAKVYEENDIIKRSIRDHYNGDIEHIYVEGEGSYKQAKDFMKMLTPSHAARVKLYKESQPIFASYNIESQLGELYQSTAPLRSGGYIVINPTEALISIDVNSGRSTTERNVEETAYKTNQEACGEIARQLRLRNLGGLVVIDFIDMGYHKNRRNIERSMKDALREDRARIQVGHISAFGLMELSRQRMGSSIEEATTQTCPVCSGSGRTMSPETLVMQMFRNLHGFLNENQDSRSVTLSVSRHILLELFNTYRDTMSAMENSLGIMLALELHADDNDSVYVFKGKGGARFDSSEPVTRKSSGKHKRNRSGSRRGGSGQEERDVRPQQAAAASPSQEAEETVNEASEQPDGQASMEREQAGEGHSRSRNRNRRRRGRGDGQRHQSAESLDGAIDNDSQTETVMEEGSVQDETETPDASPVQEETRKPRSRGRRVKAAAPEEPASVVEETAVQPERPAATPSKDVTILVEIPQLPARPESVVPAEDTPTPADRRRGWWQRVIEGE